MRCSSCDSRIRKDESYRGDSGTLYENKPLCETCYYEDEPCATVLYGNDDTPYIISSTKNETDNDFEVQWHRTDPWRGYYETTSRSYSLVNTAELLAYHESEQMLAEFDEKIREEFDSHDIDYARVFARSSNVFCQNYDVYVKKEHAPLASLLVHSVKEGVAYENPNWYRNILFDEGTLSKIATLFPERIIETDKDAYTLVEDFGEGIVDEVQRRMRRKEHK